MRFISLFLSLCVAEAVALDSVTACLSSIESTIAQFTFPNEYSACTGNLSVHSLWASAKLYCSPDEIKAGSAFLLTSGHCQGGELVPYSQIEPQLTDEYVHSLPVVDFEEMEKKTLRHTAVLISVELYATGLLSQAVSMREAGRAIRYGWALYGFWGGILLIGMISNLVSSIFHYRLARTRLDVENGRAASRTGLLQVIHHWVKAKLVIPATVGSYHQRRFGIATIPTRLETIIVCCYWVLNLILGAVSYETTWPNTSYPVPYQLWRSVANRVITLAVFNLPWVWLFAGRNNFFLWLTSWPYSTFSIFHRNIARIIFVEGVVHASSYTVLGLWDGRYYGGWHELFYRMGALALCSFGMLILFSFAPFRKKFYDFFLLTHITFAILALVGVFYHTSISNGEYNGYLWSVVAIWAIERAARLFRLCYYNIRPNLSTDPVNSLAAVSYNPKTDVIQLEVTVQRMTSTPHPGMHYFIYQPFRWRGWESHPFTLATWEPVEYFSRSGETAVENSSNLLRTAGEYEKDSKPQWCEQRQSATPDTISFLYDKKSWQRRKLFFWIRPCSGWTRSLRDACLKEPNTLHKTKVLIEGPYGHTQAIHTYDNVLYVIGGTGISVATSYLTDHAYRSATNPPTTRTKRITLLWATKQAQHILNTVKSQVQPLFRRDDVNVLFYATQQNGIPTEESDCGIQFCRPDIRKVLLEYVKDASSMERTAVIMCGPAAMADTVRDAMKVAVNNRIRNFDYFEETYGW